MSAPLPNVSLPKVSGNANFDESTFFVVARGFRLGCVCLGHRNTRRTRARRTIVAYSSLVRWSGLAAMAAGVLLLIAELLELLTGFTDEIFSELALTGLFAFQQALYLIGLTLLSVGLVGLYTRQ